MAVDFGNFVQILQNYGFLDFILPFILVFTIIFAVLQKTNIMGDKKKNFNIIIALVLGLLFVVPHIIGYYPLGYDPVQVMNEALPSLALVAVAVIMLMILMGLFGTQFTKAAAPFIAILAIGFIVYIFGSALGLWLAPYDIFYWWTAETTELIIIILVFALIVYLIVREPGAESPGKNIFKGIKDLFDKN